MQEEDRRQVCVCSPLPPPPFPNHPPPKHLTPGVEVEEGPYLGGRTRRQMVDEKIPVATGGGEGGRMDRKWMGDGGVWGGGVPGGWVVVG